MRLFKFFLFGIFLAAFWSCSDLGEPVADCPDGQPEDCADVCGGTAVLDICGVCGGDESTCNIDYITQVQPIFSANCTGCHGESGALSLASFENLMSGNSNNGPVVIEGNGAGSLIIKKLRGTSSFGSQMPLGGTPLDESVIFLIETWIKEGANSSDE